MLLAWNWLPHSREVEKRELLRTGEKVKFGGGFIFPWILD